MRLGDRLHKHKPVRESAARRQSALVHHDCDIVFAHVRGYSEAAARLMNYGCPCSSLSTPCWLLPIPCLAIRRDSPHQAWTFRDRTSSWESETASAIASSRAPSPFACRAHARARSHPDPDPRRVRRARGTVNHAVAIRNGLRVRCCPSCQIQCVSMAVMAPGAAAATCVTMASEMSK